MGCETAGVHGPQDADWELRVTDDPIGDAAAWIAEHLRRAVGQRGRATMAVSGGSTAPELWTALARHEVPWSEIEVWQVDERVRPDGHPDRNIGPLELLPVVVHPMPVAAADGSVEPDLEAAARRYAASLPESFDLVHLGLGDDGHTASWPPGDEGPIVSRRRVELVRGFRGVDRMTVTAGVVNEARSRVMVTRGADRAAHMASWTWDDHRVPVAHVRRSGTIAFVDPAAAPWQGRPDG